MRQTSSKAPYGRSAGIALHTLMMSVCTHGHQAFCGIQRTSLPAQIKALFGRHLCATKFCWL